MGKWVITVAGIAILSVLCDVILPEGQTRKYVKTVFGIVVTLVIVQPVIQLFNGGISGIFTSTSGVTDVQEQYIENALSRQHGNAVSSVISLLKNNDIQVVDMTVSDTDNTVTLQLDVAYSAQADSTVQTVVSAYFPDYDIITLWK